MLLAVAVALLALAVHVPNLPMGKSPQEDAGVFLYAARTILDGGLPYRDVWDHKPPLLYYVDALGLVLGGPSFIGVWALQALAHAGAAVLSLRVLTRAFGTWPAVAGTAAWVLAAPRVFLFEGAFSNFHQAFLAPLQFAALALFLAEERKRQRTWRTFAIGATAGAAALFTPAGIGLWLALALHIAGSRIKRAAFRPLARRTVALAAGAALPLAIVGAAFALAGILADAWEQAVAYNMHYARAATFDGRRAALGDGLRLLSSNGSAILAAAGVLAALRWRTSLPRATDGRRALDVALIALPLELFLGSSTGRQHQYYWLAALPTLGILAAFAVATIAQRTASWSGRRRIPRERAVATIAIAVVVLLSLRTAVLGARVLTSTEDGLNAAAIAYVRERTAPGDEILVWGSRSAVYVGADRTSPTRFIYQYAPLSTKGYARTEENIAEFVRAIRERRPALILDASTASAATPPLDRIGLVRFDTHDPLFVLEPRLIDVVTTLEELYEPAEPVPGTGWPAFRPKR